MYDLIIENARICDGTGALSFYGNVAVKDGLIAAVGKGNGEAPKRKSMPTAWCWPQGLLIRIPITMPKSPGIPW